MASGDKKSAVVILVTCFREGGLASSDGVGVCGGEDGVWVRRIVGLVSEHVREDGETDAYARHKLVVPCVEATGNLVF